MAIVSSLLGQMAQARTGAQPTGPDPMQAPDPYGFAAMQSRSQALMRLRKRRGLSSTILNPASGGVRDLTSAAAALRGG